MPTTTDDLTIDIRDYDEPDALMHPDNGSLTDVTENIYLVLDPEDRRVSVITLHAAARDGTPMDVFHKRKLRLRLPDDTDATKLQGWVEQRSTLIQIVFDGYSSEWDGSNMVGRYDDNAHIAHDRLQALVSDNHKHPSASLTNPVYSDPLESGFDEVPRRTVDVPTHDIVMMNGQEWAVPGKGAIIDDYNIIADTSDERLREIDQSLRDEARTDGYRLYGDLLQLLRDWRNEQ